MALREYTVLVSLDEGRNWARYAEPVSAATPRAACEQVRKTSPELHADEKAEFLALSDFRPLRKKKMLVERWAWSQADLDEPQQGQLGDG